MTRRIIFTVVLLIAVCALPIYVSAVLAIIGLCLFKDFYEVIPIFFLHDVLFGIPLHRFFAFPYVMTLLATIGVLLSGWLQKMFFRK
jgi:hypothetical protein